MSHYKRIFIIGHPGAGKRVLAEAVAKKLGWHFINADLGLEFQIGRPITEIVGNQGKEVLYGCLFEILTSLLSKEHIVVSTDACIVCDAKNQELLSSEFIVHLKVSTSVQIERTSRQPAPLLLNGDLKTFLEKLHHERDRLYDQLANLSINSNDSNLEDHVLKIVETILETNGKNEKISRIQLDKKDLIFFHKNTHTPVHLTDQQAICLKLLSEGKTSKEIARDMNISYRTVEGHIAKAMELLGCASSKELIALYHEQP